MVTPEPEYQWRQVEHTADQAIALTANSRENLFRAALDGLLGILELDKNLAAASEPMEIHLEQNSGSIENNLVDFLNDCIYYMDIEETIPVKILSIKYNEDDELECELICRPLEDNERMLAGKIKSTTYSDLEVTESDGIYNTTIIFDI
ncbi:MAG TPA: archease [bacterium]|jgi:SHS2 domain-containing protein